MKNLKEALAGVMKESFQRRTIRVGDDLTDEDGTKLYVKSIWVEGMNSNHPETYVEYEYVRPDKTTGMEKNSITALKKNFNLV